MKKTKKSVVGLAEVYRLLGGASNLVNKGLSVSSVIYCLPGTTLTRSLKTGLCGSENGF